MKGAVLTLNAGSSSLKFAVFSAAGSDDTPMISGKIAGIGDRPVFSAQGANGKALEAGTWQDLDSGCSHEAIIAQLLPWLAQELQATELLMVGHRVVHGGQTYAEPVLIDEGVLRNLDALAPLAPLHQPHNLAAIRAVAKWHPELPQIACFDTSFHRSQDRLAQLFALPRALSDEGILRYGFHGLSYDYIASALPEHIGETAKGRVIVAHLGNGASLCAMKDGKSVATSMGFTALDGLMMGRRCGALDPGVVLYLLQSKGMSAAQIETLLYKQSGLLGVSGVSNNMRVLQDNKDPDAAEAIALYCYRAATNLAALIPAIGGLDAVVFTAGIGENSALVRRLICDRSNWLGLELDAAANNQSATKIHSESSKIPVLVIPTNEEAVVARACRALLG